MAKKTKKISPIRKKSSASKAKKAAPKKAVQKTGKALKKVAKIKASPQENLAANPIYTEITSRALNDSMFTEYISKNVGSQANLVLRELLKGPRKDEQLAETVNTKLNEVRRVLNTLNKHGIVRYDVKRDSSGWLTFEWRVDHVTFSDFYKQLSQKTEASISRLPEGCNDFFVCGKCKEQGILYPFDLAYEKSFKCDCGKGLEAITRVEAESYGRN